MAARRSVDGLERSMLGRVVSVSGSISGCRNRLKSTSASAPASSSRSAISPTELQNGPSFTATGTLTAALTCATTSMVRSSTSRPDVLGGPGAW